MEQDKRSHSQEVTQLHTELAEQKGKWSELQDVISSVAEQESVSMKRIQALEANLHSKTKKLQWLNRKGPK